MKPIFLINRIIYICSFSIYHFDKTNNNNNNK